MLGFDESTDVIIEENDSSKSMKVTRKDTFFEQENTMEPDGEVCCNCRKAECKNAESSCDSSEGAPNCNSASSAKVLYNKNKAIKEDPMNEGVAYRLLREVMKDYNNVTSQQRPHTKSSAGRVPDVDVPDDRPSSSKQSGSTSPKAVSGAHMLIKKFSYSNMPKQLKELVSPSDFYNIVKKELERCESEARKPSSSQIENSTPQTIGTIHIKQGIVKQSVVKQGIVKHNLYKVANHKKEVNSISTSRESREISSKLPRKASIEDDFENMTISELIARERAAKQALSKKDFSAKSSISLSNSKVHKNTTHSKNKETKSIVKSDQLFTRSKLNLSALSNRSQITSKKIPPRSNISSDEINSSDSIVTTSDKLSYSSVSSSSSNKSHGGKSSSDYSEPQKSYIESVSDASTYKDVESISDIEIASQVYPPSVSKKEESAFKDNKNSPSAKAFTRESASSQSTLKGMTGPKSSKTVASGSSFASKKGDKPSQGKTKNAHKHNKNRPKSNSSKSSSVPSLSDITTVSSQNLNTDSVMKQISASEGKNKAGK